MRIDTNQLEFIDKQLREILTEIEVTGIEFTITSMYRIDDAGVHGTLPLRGIDLRCRDSEIGEFICKWINKFAVYDPSRPDMKCAIYHDIGQGAHIHLQVHPSTELMR